MQTLERSSGCLWQQDSADSHIDSHAEHPVLCPAPQSRGGKDVDLSLESLSSRDESASRLSPRNLLECRGNMVGVAGQGGGSRWAPRQAALKSCMSCTHGIPDHSYPSSFFYEATVTFICAQNWGVLVKGPSHVAEQLSRQNPCKRVQDSFEHPRQT